LVSQDRRHLFVIPAKLSSGLLFMYQLIAVGKARVIGLRVKFLCDSEDSGVICAHHTYSLIIIDIKCISLAFLFCLYAITMSTLIDVGVGPKRHTFSELLQSQRGIEGKVLKGHGNEPVFSMFLHKSLWPRSLTLPFKPFRFAFEFLEILVFENRLPASVNRGVDKIAWSIHFFFQPLNNSIVIVHYTLGLFFAKLVL
jgi:hypothetical protein